MFENAQWNLFEPDADESTESPAASAVETSPSPASKRGSRGTRKAGLRGATCSGSSADSDPVGSSLRTFLLCELSRLTGYSLHWKESATPAGRSWWVLGRAARPTSGTGCGSLEGWPTPRSADANRGPDYGATANHEGGGNLMGRIVVTLLADAGDAKAWVTPSAADNRPRFTPANIARRTAKGKQLMLSGQVLLDGRPVPANPSTNGKSLDWPTPRAEKQNADSHGKVPTEVKNRGALNPRWVLQLQGMPPDWLDLPESTLLKLRATRTRP
jgi:hypothetical protein